MAQAPNLQIVNGGFQTAEGDQLSNGYLLFELSHDEEYSVGPNQVVGGLKFRVDLDANGNVPSDPIVKIYSNDVLLPANSFYYVRLFDKTGTEAWASPQIWSFISTPNPIDLGSVVPASPSGSGLSGGIVALLETNGTPNGSQTLLNLQQGTGVTLTDNGSGQITIASTGAAGTVTHTGALTSNAVILGDGAADISAMSSLGTTTTVLHGNAGGAPSFGSVTEGDISLTNNTTNDVSTSQHGFAPKLPNDATKFLNGVGAYTSAGSGTVTNSGTLTSGQLIVGNGTTVIKVGDLSGDVTTSGGTATLVAKIQSNAVDTTALGAGQDGYIATWVNGTGKITFVNPTSAGGTNAIQLRGVNLATSAATPLTGEYLFYNGTNYLPIYGRQPVNTKWTRVDYSAGSLVFSSNAGVGATTAPRWIGATAAASYTAGASVAATSTEVLLSKLTSSSSATKNILIGGSGGTGINKQTSLGNLKWYRVRMGLFQTTSPACRAWIGLTDVANPATVGDTAIMSDTPAMNLVGFYYKGASDSHFQIVCQRSNITQTITPTTVTADTAIHVFEFYYDGSAVQFFIDGANVGNIAVTANIPLTSTLMDLEISVDNVGAANAVSFNFDHAIVTEGGGV